MGANTVELTDDNFTSEVLSSDSTVLVDFWAPWCGPCRQIAPLIDQLADQYAGRVKVGKINIDDNPSVTMNTAFKAYRRWWFSAVVKSPSDL
jgi:thioredoxin 1